MKTFMLAVEEGSIAQAARRLDISKAAASKQLIELESELNAQLLHRTSRSLDLTDTGRLFYQSLKNVFSAVADAEAIISHAHDKPSGTLRIASHRYFGERFIMNNINEFMTLYPGLKLDVELGDRFPDIERENFDVLCGIVNEGPDHLVRKKIATVSHVLCATPDFLAKFGMPKKPDDLKCYRFITHTFRNPDNVLTFKYGKDVYPEVYIKLNDAQSMLKCALRGLGFIKIFDYFVDNHIKKGELIEILKDYREPPKPLYIFYKQQKFIPIKIRLFIDFLAKKIESDLDFNTTNN